MTLQKSWKNCLFSLVLIFLKAQFYSRFSTLTGTKVLLINCCVCFKARICTRDNCSYFQNRFFTSYIEKMVILLGNLAWVIVLKQKPVVKNCYDHFKNYWVSVLRPSSVDLLEGASSCYLTSSDWEWIFVTDWIVACLPTTSSEDGDRSSS